jgi:hypothetical protein
MHLVMIVPTRSVISAACLIALYMPVADNFLEDNTLHRLVTSLLNEKNTNKSDKVRLRLKIRCGILIAHYENFLQDTKLDVLNILANVAASKNAVAVVIYPLLVTRKYCCDCEWNVDE